jgi:hypothetical protein
VRWAALLLLFAAACGPRLTPEEAAYARLTQFAARHRTGSRNWTAEDRAATHRLVRAYLGLPRHDHPDWQGRAYTMLWRLLRNDPRADRGELMSAIRGMEQYASFPVPRFIEPARWLAERNVDLDYAERLARRGVIESHRYFQRHPEEEDTPRFIAGVVARAHESLAIVLEKRGRRGEAEQERVAAAAMFRSVR